MTQRIIVIGAGIAGIATAVALQRQGHEVVVIEARRDTSSGAGISIWPNALAALDAIGVGDAVRDSGGRVAAGAMRWSNGAWLRRPSPERIVRALGEPLMVVRRSTLMSVLTDALAPDTIESGWPAEELVITETGPRLTLSDGTTMAAAAVIGADGVNSMVARHLNGPLTHRYAGYTAWRGIAAYRLPADLAGETVGTGTEFGHVPLGSDHTYWFCSERRPEGVSSPDGELTYLRAKYAAWAEPVPALLGATDPTEVLRNDVYDRGEARQWSRGPVVIVGDAAHPMRPHLGQGGCQGLEDAAILADCVGRGPASPADLRDAFTTFAAFRRPRARALARESRLLGRIVNTRPALLGAAAMRSSAVIPEAVLTRHLASVAGRSAFVLPSRG